MRIFSMKIRLILSNLFYHIIVPSRKNVKYIVIFKLFDTSKTIILKSYFSISFIILSNNKNNKFTVIF